MIAQVQRRLQGRVGLYSKDFEDLYRHVVNFFRLANGHAFDSQFKFMASEIIAADW